MDQYEKILIRINEEIKNTQEFLNNSGINYREILAEGICLHKFYDFDSPVFNADFASSSSLDYFTSRFLIDDYERKAIIEKYHGAYEPLYRGAQLQGYPLRRAELELYGMPIIGEFKAVKLKIDTEKPQEIKFYSYGQVSAMKKDEEIEFNILEPGFKVALKTDTITGLYDKEATLSIYPDKVQVDKEKGLIQLFKVALENDRVLGEFSISLLCQDRSVVNCSLKIRGYIYDYQLEYCYEGQTCKATYGGGLDLAQGDDIFSNYLNNPKEGDIKEVIARFLQLSFEKEGISDKAELFFKFCCQRIDLVNQMLDDAIKILTQISSETPIKELRERADETLTCLTDNSNLSRKKK